MLWQHVTGLKCMQHCPQSAGSDPFTTHMRFQMFFVCELRAANVTLQALSHFNLAELAQHSSNHRDTHTYSQVNRYMADIEQMWL